MNNRTASLWRRPLAGILIFIMILVTIVAGLYSPESHFNPLLIAGLAGWLAAILLFIDTPLILRLQVGIILAVGLALIVYAIRLGGQVSIDAIITANTRMLTMIAAVGFLRLVALPLSSVSEALPTGPGAYLRTLLGLNVSSSVINISAPILFADRIHQFRPLKRFTSQSMTRVFCGVSTWSPFYGAMAVVLTYLIDAELVWIILAGLPFMLLGFLLVLTEARLCYRSELESFVGYPMHLQSLAVPLLLVVSVFIGTWLLPTTAILVVIALFALLVTIAVLLYRSSIISSWRALGQYIVEGLPRIVNELTLFLAAGLIAAGMSASIELGIIDNPFDQFNAATAAIVLGCLILLSAMGIHPVIFISSFTPMLLTLNPDPNLLATTYLIGWNLGTCSSPLSGTHLVFQGRYDIPSWKAAVWNWPYAIVMYGFAVAWLFLLEKYFV